MPKPAVSKTLTHRLCTAVGFFALCTGLLTSVSAADAPANSDELKWDTVFSKRNTPQSLQFSAHFWDGKGAEHRLKYWREGGTRLRRNTDDHVDVMVERLHDGEYRYHVLDHRKKIITDIDQTNLVRIGRFIHWDDLAHIVTKPKVDSRLSKSPAKDLVVNGARCQWYLATPTAVTTAPTLSQHICWSVALGIPLKMTQASAGQAETTTWQVDTVSTKKLTDAAFTAHVAGYAVVDANQDIGPSGD